MCGIAGFVGEKARQRTCQMIEALKHRGPDGLAVQELGDACLGHAHLKVTGDFPQPVTAGNVTFVYNGEIYNHSDFLPGSTSDTEVLASILKAGIAGFESAAPKIDGEYAFAARDGSHITLVRDPLGIKPLYYGCSEAGFGFASERKALMRVGIRDIRSLSPGCMLAEGRERRFADLPPMQPAIVDEQEAVRLLDEALSRAVWLRLHKDAAVTFSGGIDSALIGAMAPDTPLLTVGLPGSFDVKAAIHAARAIGAEHRHTVYEVTEKDVEEALPGVIYAIESASPVSVSIALPLYILSARARADGYKVLLSGQGSDELFAGYARYEAGYVESRLQEMLDHDQRHLAEVNLERDDAAAMASGVELRVPYLDLAVVSLARQLDPSLKLRVNGKDYIRKYVLRKVAENYFPPDVSGAPKKAIQYGTGIQKTLERLARSHGCDLAGYLQTLYKVVLV
ncbi:asparagine synthetase B family protein [Methanocella arvoryzae]|uniref:Putative asparagine synthetase [glutamine-hydrolyzing] n=1 Tax=Methanocella arvoryzae (strain DSM 22066 / NBRC 105507 / MRE50) TaxID=351160 RepID=Q0W279_METAR|nr:asparagine synthetase B [Methanocella arvoryzae]CAJ37514.1 putative asparagine synthetase,glutamine-hydrolyzing [Methanocella arvoryzae MRE50]